MAKSKGKKLRFLELGALTATLVGTTTATFRSLAQADTVPQVDGLAEAAPEGGDWPFISIIVPARNEERNLPRLLPTLLAQRYPSYEVVVVDDQSTDGTAAVVAGYAGQDKRLKLVNGRDLPRDEGWLGKPHAMHQGANVARGAWLLFTDADTTHNPVSLSSSVAYVLRHNLDMLTILPSVELGTPSERLLMPVAFMGIATFYPPSKVNDPVSKVAIANGQFMLVRRDVYDAVGGAERVKGKIAEDLEFGKAVKGDGYRLYLADGRHLMTVRMYTNLQELWRGWGKNVVLSFRENPEVGLFSVAGIILSPTLPFFLFRWARTAWREAGKTHTASDEIAAAWAIALAIGGAALPFIYRRRIDDGLGLPIGWTLTQPLGTTIFGLILLDSFVRLVTGKGVTWKGRTYASRTN